MVLNKSHTSDTVKASKTITPEEKADLGSGTIAALSDTKLFVVIYRIKLRLQFTGWLQYIPFAISSIIFFLLAALAHFLGMTIVFNILAIIGIILSVILISDLVTVKYRLHLHEHLPKRNDSLNIYDLMRARHSCRAFQNRKLTDTDRDELMRSVRLHSNSPKISTAPVRFEYISAPLMVWPVVNASEFLVAIAPKEYDRLAVIDIGRSLQKVVMDATRMGLATCWIGPGADHDSIIKDLGARFNPGTDHIICVCAVGYQSRYRPMFIRIFNRQFHQRLPLSSLFFADSELTKPLDLEAYPFEKFGRNFEICQWAPSSYNGQSTRCAAVTDKNGRLKRFDFYAATISRYYAPVALGIWCANWELGCQELGIHGHLSVLTPEQRGIPAGEQRTKLPRYDISWVLDDGLN